MRPKERIIQVLESFRQRKHMYLSPVTAHTAETYLAGFQTGCFASGIIWDYREAGIERGWEMNAAGPVPEMQGRGLSDDEIIDELIAIHIAAIQRTEL